MTCLAPKNLQVYVLTSPKTQHSVLLHSDLPQPEFQKSRIRPGRHNRRLQLCFSLLYNMAVRVSSSQTPRESVLCWHSWPSSPIAKTWNKKLDGHCLEIGEVWYSTSVMAILTDVAIIILPLYQIRRLQMPLFQKLALCLMFSLGILWVISPGSDRLFDYDI